MKIDHFPSFITRVCGGLNKIEANKNALHFTFFFVVSQTHLIILFDDRFYFFDSQTFALWKFCLEPCCQFSSVSTNRKIVCRLYLVLAFVCWWLLLLWFIYLIILFWVFRLFLLSDEKFQWKCTKFHHHLLVCFNFLNRKFRVCLLTIPPQTEKLNHETMEERIYEIVYAISARGKSLKK